LILDEEMFMTLSAEHASIIESTCTPDSVGHCITCSDQALEALVLRIDLTHAMALVEVENQTTEVDISLVDGAAPGDRLLIHGGVAIARL
jgi:hypothetical protein